MKKSEIALLIVIVSLVATVTFFSIKLIVGDQATKPVGVEKANGISPDIVAPSSEIFNDNAINPTVQVNIGEGEGNKLPFGD